MLKYIIANWKANKTEKETIEWFTEITTFDFNKLKDIEIIACLPFVFLAIAKEEIKKNMLPIKLGAQNVSHFKEGPYTGVVTAKMLQGLVDYVLIGHSERRELLKETDELVIQKTILALEYNIIPIICFSTIEQVKLWQKGVTDIKGKENPLFLYEPIEAIGSGKPEDPLEVKNKVKEIKNIVGEMPVLYGGSATPNNINSYFNIENIDGVAVGGASLDPKSFLKILATITTVIPARAGIYIDSELNSERH